MQDRENIPAEPGKASGEGAVGQIKPVKKAHLINKLNYINFQEGTIQIVFGHSKYDHTVSLRAIPQPCLGEELECIWPETELETYRTLNAYRFKEIQVPDGKDVIVIRPEDIFINGKVANFLLPETSDKLQSRALRRYPCNNIKAQLTQNSIAFQGTLMDFNRSFFRVEILEQDHQAFYWINNETPINLILTNDTGMIFSGECNITQVRNGLRTRKNFILGPKEHRIKRFSPKDYRVTRYELVPSPHIIFSHPFTHKKWALNILDVSGSGFSVKEDTENGLLVPGMILRNLEIHLANSLDIRCTVQVVHQTSRGNGEAKGSIKTGLAILDMSIEDHGKLLSLLHHAKNPNLFLNGHVTEDDLWRFFFESGFIYPRKYKFIQDKKEDLKATYRKLYSDSPNIAKHLIYQDRGQILGHMSIIRFYQKSWMIQHHAADHNKSSIAGIEVLDQICRFVNECGNLINMNMEYLFCYYRPDNKFPNQVFGGAARNIKNPKICSLDDFAYFHYTKRPGTEQVEIKSPWQITTARPEDLVELKLFYEQNSGGIMMEAIELLPELMDVTELIQAYTYYNFKRGRYIFTLRKENRIKAIFCLNLSDFGLNLSDITNSIHVFVVDPEGFNEEILEFTLRKLSTLYEDTDIIPVMLYPKACADELNIAYEKVYQICSLDIRGLDYYFDFIKKIFKRLLSLQSSGAVAKEANGPRDR